MKDSADRSNRFYDRNTKEPEIQVGNKVLLHRTVLKAGESPKFHYNWTGPYLAVSKSDNGLLYRPVIALLAKSQEPRCMLTD